MLPAFDIFSSFSKYWQDLKYNDDFRPRKFCYVTVEGLFITFQIKYSGEKWVEIIRNGIVTYQIMPIANDRIS